MGFGIGLLMTAAGAILIRAVNVATALSLVFWSSWAGPAGVTTY